MLPRRPLVASGLQATADRYAYVPGVVVAAAATGAVAAAGGSLLTAEDLELPSTAAKIAPAAGAAPGIPVVRLSHGAFPHRHAVPALAGCENAVFW